MISGSTNVQSSRCIKQRTVFCNNCWANLHECALSTLPLGMTYEWQVPCCLAALVGQGWLAMPAIRNSRAEPESLFVAVRQVPADAC